MICISFKIVLTKNDVSTVKVIFCNVIGCAIRVYKFILCESSISIIIYSILFTRGELSRPNIPHPPHRPTGNGCFCMFHTWPLPTSTCSHFINATQKTLKSSKKMFQSPGWMRKNFKPWNFSWRVSAETWDASCFKNGRMEKQQSVPNTLKEIFFQNLTDAFFNYL